MKIISYNVNGIRAALTKGLDMWLKIENPDVICLQETKAEPGQVDGTVFEKLGYHLEWNSAEKKGYSGVALFSKMNPDKIVHGIGKPEIDSEGRVLRADFGDLTIVSVYVPSGTMGDVRQDFKMEFLDAFYIYAVALKKERPKLIISGDFNICHKPIDINHPERHQQSSGFLPEERAWVDKFIAAGFIDSFRKFDNREAQYSWWSYRQNSRGKNLGWRIDYHFAGSALENELKSATILQDIVHSDHCPVSVTIQHK